MANLTNMQLVSDPVRRGAGEAPKGPTKHLGVAAAMRFNSQTARVIVSPHKPRNWLNPLICSAYPTLCG
jgi:hypothetical protein